MGLCKRAFLLGNGQRRVSRGPGYRKLSLMRKRRMFINTWTDAQPSMPISNTEGEVLG